jgi:hypothetical protein
MITPVAVVDTELISSEAGRAPRGRRATSGPDDLGSRRLVRLAAATSVVIAAGVLLTPLIGLQDGQGLAAAALWMLAGALVLRPPYLLVHVGIAAAAMAAALGVASSAVQPELILSLVVLDGMVLGFGTSRRVSAAHTTVGESMLAELRDRLHAQGTIPPLEPGWQVETALRAAHGDAFSGDFLVAGRRVGDSSLELVLVDVSGKGRAAGSRALLLSGAFGGLLGALPGEEFLPAANRYVLRQGWDEGFATAVHVEVDLCDGTFRVSGAGHPPSARFHSGSGRWEVFSGEQGPVLGVIPDARYPAVTGRLEYGDALLLYTDGLVETPGQDVELGIDRLMGQAERAMTRGFHGGAAAIVDGARAGDGDDRALILIWRA